MTAISKIQNGMARAFNKARAKLIPEGAVCYLLKRAGQTGTRFTVVKQLTSGWYAEFDNFRQQVRFSVATTSATFSDEIAQVNYIAYGVPDANSRVDLYGLIPDSVDTVAPTGNNPEWKIFATRIPNERYTVS